MTEPKAVPSSSIEDLRTLLRDPHWWMRDIATAFIVGVLVSVAAIWGQKSVDDTRATRDSAVAAQQVRHAEQMENLQFIRSLSSPDSTTPRPFGHLDLQGLALVNLDLAGSDFAYANLAEVNLSHTDLARADLSRANLTNADLNHANLIGARLSTDRFLLSQSPQPGANLIHANLAGTDLAGADLDQADLTDVYYDATTRWPTNFRPPPSRDEP